MPRGPFRLEPKYWILHRASLLAFIARGRYVLAVILDRRRLCPVSHIVRVADGSFDDLNGIGSSDITAKAVLHHGQYYIHTHTQ